MAASPAHRRPRSTVGVGVRNLVLVGALLASGCEQLYGSYGGPAGESEQDSAGGVSTVSPMANAAEIRDGACYEDFALATQAIDAKLADSVQDIGASAQIGDESLRQDIILGLRFNANLQKRVAFDTLEACLR
ncbi:MAG: hypothetical protein HKM95_12200 [Inquilinus sp.]|nr:hypothetical protein [Inquilinus sp.]